MRDPAIMLCAFPFLDAVVVQLFSGGLGFLVEGVFQVVDGVEGVLKGVEGGLVVLLELFGDSTEAGFDHDFLQAVADIGRVSL